MPMEMLSKASLQEQEGTKTVALPDDLSPIRMHKRNEEKQTNTNQSLGVQPTRMDIKEIKTRLVSQQDRQTGRPLQKSTDKPHPLDPVKDMPLPRRPTRSKK
mmetsp:Transcript_35889/g.53588  ORF Transcript_35889/g.53588 Transcript_35889/m.53588 type:complete len:102 (+) Transcript_35889:49-354(+)